MVVNYLLVKLSHQRFKVQIYADDIAILIRGILLLTLSEGSEQKLHTPTLIGPKLE